MKKLFAPLALAVLASTLPAQGQEPSSAVSSAPAVAPAPATPAPAPAVPATPVGAAKGGGGVVGQVIDRVLATLSLTPEQQVQVAAVRQKFEASTATLLSDVRAQMMELRKLRSAPETDPAAVESKSAALAEAQAQLRGEVDKFYSEVDLLLDPAQRTKLAEVRAMLREGSQPPSALPPAGAAKPGPGAGQV